MIAILGGIIMENFVKNILLTVLLVFFISMIASLGWFFNLVFKHI